MNIEAGKSYRTVRGRKVTICAMLPPEIAQDNPYVAVGHHEHFNHWMHWTADGKHSDDPSDILNLVAEWREPVIKEATVYLYRRLDNSVFAECCTYDGRCGVEVIAKKTITLTEGEGL